MHQAAQMAQNSMLYYYMVKKSEKIALYIPLYIKHPSWLLWSKAKLFWAECWLMRLYVYLAVSEWVPPSHAQSVSPPAGVSNHEPCSTPGEGPRALHSSRPLLLTPQWHRRMGQMYIFPHRDLLLW